MKKMLSLAMLIGSLLINYGKSHAKPPPLRVSAEIEHSFNPEEFDFQEAIKSAKRSIYASCGVLPKANLWLELGNAQKRGVVVRVLLLNEAVQDTDPHLVRYIKTRFPIFVDKQHPGNAFCYMIIDSSIVYSGFQTFNNSIYPGSFLKITSRELANQFNGEWIHHFEHSYAFGVKITSK